jgi:hypothetical protein
MTLHIINGGGEHHEPEPPEVEPNNSASELYQEFVKVLGGYTNQAVLTACAALAAHASDSAGWKRQDALPELIRLYFQIDPIPGKKEL